MRRPVIQPYTISGSYGDDYGSASKFRYHSGVDYAFPSGREIYAPISGTVSGYTWGRFHGHTVQIFDGAFYHRMMHNSQLRVSPGQRVTEGQLVAISGTTGQGVTGPHCHWDICTKPEATAFSDFRDPAKWLNGEYNNLYKQGEAPMTPQEEANAYQIVLNRGMEHGGSGRTGYKFIVDAKGELDNLRGAQTNLVNTLNQKVTEMTNIINNLSARPTNQEYAVAQAQLADKVAELEAAKKALEAEEKKVKHVLVHDEETAKGIQKLLVMVTALFDYFSGQYKSFKKYIKK